MVYIKFPEGKGVGDSKGKVLLINWFCRFEFLTENTRGVVPKEILIPRVRYRTMAAPGSTPSLVCIIYGPIEN